MHELLPEILKALVKGRSFRMTLPVGRSESHHLATTVELKNLRTHPAHACKDEAILFTSRPRFSCSSWLIPHKGSRVEVHCSSPTGCAVLIDLNLTGPKPRLTILREKMITPAIYVVYCVSLIGLKGIGKSSKTVTPISMRRTTGLGGRWWRKT